MKKTDRNYEAFKAEFEKRQRQFGLMGYKIFFEAKKLDNTYADIKADRIGMIAKVRFNNKLEPSEKPDANPRETGKHEAIHLLIHRLDNIARCRYLTDSEVDEAEEELVRKLEDLIP